LRRAAFKTFSFLDHLFAQGGFWALRWERLPNAFSTSEKEAITAAR
jgi:hypothetical protein